MHKRGVAVILSAVITANTLPIGTVVSYADEVKQEVSALEQDLKEENKQNTKVAEEERTFTGKVNISNPQFGTIEGIVDGEEITHRSYFLNTSTSWGTTSGTLDESRLEETKKIKITPKSGYKWSYELESFDLAELGMLTLDNTISLEGDEKYGVENTMFIKPITYNKWNKLQPKDLSGEINITFNPRNDAEQITLEVSENGNVEPELDNLYFEGNTALIDKGSIHTFILNPHEGYKIGEVTLNDVPVSVENNKVTVGAGTLQVKFVEDVQNVETQDFNISLNENGSVTINNQTITENTKVVLEKGKEHKFTVKASEGKYVDSVKLGDIELQSQNGVYIIPADTESFDINITFKNKMDVNLELGELKVPYDGQEKKLECKVVGPNGEIVDTIEAVFTRKNIWGREEQYNPKETGLHNFKVEFSGNEKYNPTSTEGTFEIYDAREEAILEIEGLGNIENIDTIQRVYNNENQEVKYNIIGKDGEIITSGKAKFIKDVLGVPVEVNAKNVGTYKLKVEFDGNENYKPLKIEKELEITKFKPSVKVGNISIPYSGEKIKTPVEVTYNAGYINVYTGINLNLGAEVNIDLNLGDDLIGKTISDIFNNLGSPTIGDLKKILKDSEGLLSGLGVNVDDIIKALDYIPEDFKINFGAPSKAGAYLSTAIVLDQNAEIAVGVGSLHIYRQQKNVVFTEDSLKDKEVITLEQVDDYTHEAYYEGTTNKVKIVYSGITAKGEAYFSQDKPITEGVYVATAYSYDDPQYSVGLAMRTFTIIKELKNVEFTAESLEDKAVIKVGTDYKHEAKIEGTDKNALIKYTGITLSGKKYSSTERPKEAGTYMAVAYSPEDDKYITGLGIRTFTIIREQKDVVFTDDSLEDKSLVKVGQNYSHKAIYKDTDKEAKIMYSGVTVSGKLYFSEQKPTEEGIYVATAYSYDDHQYSIGLAMRTFSISKLTTKIEVKNDTKVYDGKEFKPEVVVTNRFGEVVENPKLKYTYYNGTTKLESAPIKAGNYKVVVTFMGDDQHIKSYISKNFTIEKANLVVNIDNAIKAKGFNDPTFTYSLEGLVEHDNVEFELVREDGEEVGKYEINVKEQELENYNYTVNKGTLTINPLISILNRIPTIKAEDVVIKVGDKFDPKLYATAYDEEDGNITDSIEVVTNKVDTTKAGVYEVVYKVSDSKGASATKTIKVTVNPLISVLNRIPIINAEDLIITVGDKFEPKSYATASDEEDGNITGKIEVVTNKVDTTKLGIYEVVYKVTDKDGASATKTIKVTVQKYTQVTSVKLDKTSLTLEKGNQEILLAIINPSNASNKEVVWSSSNENIVTVDENGKLTGISDGIATITVQTKDKRKKATCKVTVITPIKKIEIKNDPLDKMVIGQYIKLIAEVNNEETNKNIIWSSSNPKIATVDSKGKVTAKGSGEVTITARVKDNDLEATWTTKVVKPISILNEQGEDVSSVNFKLANNENIPLTAIVNIEGINQEVLWSSSNKKVATIDKNGKLTGVSDGTTTITVQTKDKRKKVTFKVTVITPIEKIEIKNDILDEMVIGQYIKLIAKVNDEETNKNIIWSSSNPKIATVDSKGKVTAKGSGEVTITARVKGSDLEATWTTKVVKPITILNQDGEEVSSGSLRLGEDNSIQLTAKVNPYEGTNQKVVWKSSNKKVAIVDENGNITAVGKGTATITVKSVANKKSVKYKVKVIQPVESIKLNKEEVSMKVGKLVTLKPIFNPSNSSEKGVTWYSSDSDVATISKTGRVKALKAGTTTITATTIDGNHTATCTITVE